MQPNPFFAKINSITLTEEKSSQKIWATSAIFKKTGPRKKSSHWRKLAQSGHPVCLRHGYVV
jgi:hypothetical protein